MLDISPEQAYRLLSAVHRFDVRSRLAELALGIAAEHDCDPLDTVAGRELAAIGHVSDLLAPLAAEYAAAPLTAVDARDAQHATAAADDASPGSRIDASSNAAADASPTTMCGQVHTPGLKLSDCQPCVTALRCVEADARARLEAAEVPA